MKVLTASQEKTAGKWRIRPDAHLSRRSSTAPHKHNFIFGPSELLVEVLRHGPARPGKVHAMCISLLRLAKAKAQESTSQASAWHWSVTITSTEPMPSSFQP